MERQTVEIDVGHENEERVFTEFGTRVEALLRELEKRLIGQDEVARGLILGLMTESHVLLEGVPGLAKTTE